MSRIGRLVIDRLEKAGVEELEEIERRDDERD